MPGLFDLIDAINVPARIEILIGAAFRKRAPAQISIARGDGDMTGTDACAFLNERGVRTWAGRTREKWWTLCVSKQQEREAVGLLMGAGVEIECIPQGVKPIRFNRLWRAGGAPAAQLPAAQQPQAKPDKPKKRGSFQW